MIRNLSIEEKICESFFAENIKQAEMAIQNLVSFGELRFDLSQLIIDDLKILKKETSKGLIFTCRKGKFSDEERILAYQEAINVGFKYIDLDYRTDIEIHQQLKELLQSSSCKLIISYHDFEKTPASQELKQLIQQLKALQPNLAKFAFQTHSLDDVETLKNIQKNNQDIICFGMGKYATESRVESILNGGLFTYCALDTTKNTAPGQVNYRQLEKEYIRKIKQKHIRLAVLGNPISHSKSPAVFARLFSQSQISGVYEKLELDSIEDFNSLKKEYHGFNVTAPFKQSIIKYLDHISEAAKAIGAVNTIYQNNGLWKGDNTDYLGIINALKSSSRIDQWPIKNCLILGAGGAARAAVFALQELDFQIYISNRTHSKAEELAQEFPIQSLSKDNIELSNFHLIINTIPQPFSLIDASQLYEKHTVLDAIYPNSPFYELQFLNGFQLIEGEQWLWYQAVAAFKIFTKS